MVSSKHCPTRDLNELKYKYTVPELMKVHEYIEMISALETAHMKDEEAAAKVKTDVK